MAGLFRSIYRKLRPRNATYHGGYPSSSSKLARLLGIDVPETHVSAESSLGFSPYLACLRVISETIGSLSRHVYQSQPTGRQQLNQHPLVPILATEANSMMTASVFWESLCMQMLHYGDGVAYINRSPAGQVDGLWLLNSATIKIVRTGNDLYYITQGQQNEPYTLRADQVIHIPSPMTLNGISGVPAWQYVKRALKLGTAAESFATRYFEHGTHIGHVVEMDGTPPKDKRDELKNSMEEFHEGLKNAHRVLFLPSGMKHQAVGVEPEKSQLLELRGYETIDIARVMRIPPVFLQEFGRATWSNSSESERFLVKHTLRPYLVRIEQELNRKLFAGREAVDHFIRFEIDSLLRGDVKTRYETYRIGRQWGWLSANDIRQLEDMPAIDGGDAYLLPSNMTTTASPNNTQSVLADATRRLLTKEINAIKRKFSKADIPEFAEWVREWYADHEQLAAQTYTPVAEAMHADDPEAVADDLAARHVQQSRDGILAALTAEDPEQAITQTMNQWESRYAT